MGLIKLTPEDVACLQPRRRFHGVVIEEYLQKLVGRHQSVGHMIQALGTYFFTDLAFRESNKAYCP